MAMVPGPNYNEGLFGCFNDIPGCLYGLCCTPCQMGALVETAKLEPCFNSCCCLILWNYLPICGMCVAPMKYTEAMNKVETQFGISVENHTTCFPTVCCCAACATCRLKREVDQRMAAGVMPAGPGVSMAAPQAQMMQPMQPHGPKA